MRLIAIFIVAILSVCVATPLGASQKFLNNKAIDIVSYTFEQIMRRNNVTIEKMKETGIRCRIYVEQTEHDLLVYCFYA